MRRLEMVSEERKIGEKTPLLFLESDPTLERFPNSLAETRSG